MTQHQQTPRSSAFPPNWQQDEFDFDGVTYDRKRDGPRLNDQLRRVVELMVDGKPRTLREISDATGDPESSCSARLRDVRKERFGLNYTVEREYVRKGLWRYRLAIKTCT